MHKHAILSQDAPAPIGPYAQAVRVGDWVFLSGQIPVDPHTGEVVEGGVAAQFADSPADLGARLEHGNLIACVCQARGGRQSAHPRAYDNDRFHTQGSVHDGRVCALTARRAAA